MSYDCRLWSSGTERGLFLKLVFWNGENKDPHFFVNRVEYGNGFFDVDQAFIKANRIQVGRVWKNKHKFTRTAIARHFHKWASEGMMIEQHTKGQYGKQVLIYKWKD